MDKVVAESFVVGRTSFVMILLGLAALVALLLGAVGIYGVLAYVVGRRTSEIGLRIALGATSGNVWSAVLGRGLVPVVIGIAAGLVAAILGSRVLTPLLFQTSPLDVSTLLAGPVVFLLVAATACVIPARRATRIDPVEALRAE